MNNQDFQNIINTGENETTEFKKSTAQTDSALKTICGFLNHKGGTIYFGISDKNELVGQQVSDSTLKSISQKIRQKIKPETSPNIKVIEINKKKIIEVKVKKGSNSPYYLAGIAYRRVGSETPPIAPEELEDLILNKNRCQWDSEVCKGATLEDIDEAKLKWFLKEAKIRRKYPIDENISVNDALAHLGLLDDGKLTNASVLLFGRNPQKVFLQAEIKCVHFHGTEIEKPFKTYHVYGNNIFQQIDNVGFCSGSP